MVSIKRVAYGYNSKLEELGQEAYFLDALECEDAEVVVDVHRGFKTKREFLEAIEALVPMIGGSEDA